MVIYCKSVHFHGFEDAKKNLSFYEMSSFKEGKAVKLAEESGETPEPSAWSASSNHSCFHDWFFFFSRRLPQPTNTFATTPRS